MLVNVHMCLQSSQAMQCMGDGGQMIIRQSESGQSVAEFAEILTHGGHLVHIQAQCSEVCQITNGCRQALQLVVRQVQDG